MLTVRERRSHIADHIATVGHGSVAVLAERYQVTPETIRRDLSYLEQQGKVSRVHGGAVSLGSNAAEETSYWHNEHAHAEQKLAIARAAAALLPEGTASILLDAGTTTGALAEALIPLHAGHRWTVVTNSLPAGATLAAAGMTGVNLIGGTIKAYTQAVVGEQATEAIRQLRADFAFIGTNGISTHHGMSTPDPAEAAVKRAMVQHSQTTVVLADSSKFDQDYLVTFAEFEDIDILVTDDGLPTDYQHFLESHNIKVVRS
ncbi:D-beta-D-heptose 1-phosphate adenosyltransferase [Corynebacterium sp. 13CS0277]|uniref:DeoR/GlpR family DNA-binding transcription regulator n=1 Tax=Corynebacterium sp. 13CS0277 TaxID=2071994 RepID=UPI000D027F49|nr:DeoR/GlpR family DNA-binding transcription regulator [Corynebacterium sp. 13CS0277]PRQ10562.1 D-beta-D-heptose 1-phosphate adenosyltransferase [Corynebacterium sp. 13CS0277]